MADKRISQLVERVTLANNDVFPIVASGATTTNKVTLQTMEDYFQANMDFGVTSVAMTVPTGLSVSGSPIVSTGTFVVSFQNGYSIPTTAKQAEWDAAYNDKINSVSVSGTTTKTITLTQQDGGTLSASWSDLQPVTSVFGRTGDVVATEGDYSLDQLSDVTITSPTNQQVLKYNGTSWVNATEQFVGTVTSVGVSVPSAFSVSGSPITTSGTITISGAGTSAQYIDGTGSLQTFPTLIAEATNLVREVYNNSGATMLKGTVVYINGGHGNLPTIAKAQANADATSAQTYGVVQSNIGDQSNGYLVVVGDLIGIDTQGWLEGTQLYLSPTTAGGLTSTKQYAPNHLVYVGIVTRSHPTQGVIAVKIQNGYEMDELHDVSAQNPNDNDILQYKNATGLWTKTAGTTTNIAEGTNLYYTDSRARQSISETITGIDYDNTTGVFSITSGYGIPTTAKQTQWDSAYNDKINSAAVTGTTTKTLTLTQQDGGTITASWTDDNTDAVTSVFGRTGAVVATEGDYNLTQLGDVTITTPSNGQVLKYNGTAWINDTGYVGTVTSVGLSVPTGLSVSGSPITTSGTLAISFAAGYSIPTTTKQSEWDSAYNDKINSAAVTGTTTKTLTLTQQDGGTITASWTDINTDAVTSVFGRTGAVVAAEGDYSLNQLSDVAISSPTNGQFLKYDGTTWLNAAAGTVTSVALATGTTGTDVGVIGSPITGSGTITLNIPTASATNRGALSSADWSTFNAKQGAITLTTTGTSGAATLVGNTLNIPNYSPDLSGYVTIATTQTITGAKTFENNSTDTLILTNTEAFGQDVGAYLTMKGQDGTATRTFAYIHALKENSTSGNYASRLAFFTRANGASLAVAMNLASNKDATFYGKIIKSGGTSSQFLKADGSVDSNSYVTGGPYVPTSRTLTINGTAYDLSSDRTWSVGTITGSGTTNKIPKWTSGTVLGDSIIYDGNSYVEVSGIFRSTSRLGVGIGSDQNYASIFIGGDITNGVNQYALLCDPQLSGTSNSYAIFANPRIKANTAVANTFGVYIPTAEKLTGATISNSYALYIANQTSGSSSNYSIYSSGGGNYFGGAFEINNTLTIGAHQALKPSGFGYDTNGYKILIVGQPGLNSYKSIAFGVDVSANPSGAFSGWGQEYVWKNAASFITPNSSNNGYNTLLSWNSSGNITINNPVSTSSVSISGTLSQTTTSTQPVAIYGDSAGINGLFRIQIDEVNDAFGSGARTFLGDGGIDLFIGTGNGSYTPANTYIALNHSGEISMGAGSGSKHFIMLSGGSSEFKRPLIVNGNGTYSVGTPALNIQSASWALVDATVYRQMQRCLGNANDYEQHVILLHPIYNGTNLIEWNNCNGKIYATRGWTYAGRIGDVYEVHTETAYNSYAGNLIGHGATGKLYTCTYNSRKYLALIPDYRTSAVTYHFDGYISNNTGGETLKIVTYRMSNTGTIVISEIYNSLAAYGEDYTWQRGTFYADALNIQGTSLVSGVHTQQGALRINNGTGGTSPVITFGTENESVQGFKGIYLDSYWMYIQVHYNEGLRIRGVNGVGGSQTIATFAGASGNFTALGDVTAYSDARYKTNVKPVENALSKVLQLEGVTYNRTDLDTNKNRIGLIAQEVEKVLPEVVNIDDDGIYSVAYGNMVGLLIEAMKEQQKQIEELKKVVYGIA